jgi:hypothetical protein
MNFSPQVNPSSTAHGYSFGPDPVGELHDSITLADQPDDLRDGEAWTTQRKWSPCPSRREV